MKKREKKRAKNVFAPREKFPPSFGSHPIQAAFCYVLREK